MVDHSLGAIKLNKSFIKQKNYSSSGEFCNACVQMSPQGGDWKSRLNQEGTQQPTAITNFTYG